MPTTRSRSQTEISNRSSKRSRSTRSTTQASRKVQKKKAPIKPATVKKLKPTGIPLVEPPTVCGTIYAFGTGDTGQLGLGENQLIRKKPMPLIIPDHQIVDVACGGMHTVATCSDGKLLSFGCNDQYALGRNGDEYVPALVDNMEGVHVVKAVCSDSATLALSDQGILYCWGTFRSAEGILGFSKTTLIQQTPALFEPFNKLAIADIAAGTDHCLALSRDGRVFVWGNGQQYQLGRRMLNRHLINGLRPEALNLRNIRLIGSGSYHSFAVSEDNTLYTWGLNNFQQCGLVNEETGELAPDLITKPTVVTSLRGKGIIKSVEAGEHHTIVLMEDGHVYAFGRVDSSQLGLPQDVIEAKQITDEGSKFKSCIGVPTLIPSLSNISQIAAGTNHNLALDSSGEAFAWGFGEVYCLANGFERDEPIPCKVTGQKLEGHTVLRVSAGAQHSIILGSI